MALDVRIDDNGNLSTLARALRGVDRDMKRKVTDELVATTRPTKSAIRSSARSTLPSRGGLAALIASASVTTKVVMGANPKVSLRTDLAGHALAPIDRGTVRHPVYGRGRWVTQSVTPGYFSDPVRNDMPRIRRGVERTVDRVVADRLRALKG